MSMMVMSIAMCDVQGSMLPFGSGGALTLLSAEEDVVR
jgi:hypothetical protein